MNETSDRVFYLLTYDISDNKRRTKLAKILESLGLRVQGSVFEGWLTAGELSSLLKRSKPLVRVEADDSLRIYPFCRACREKAILIGTTLRAEKPSLVIL